MKTLLGLLAVLCLSQQSRAACTGTALHPGDDVPAKVAASAEGTTFCFDAGTFRITRSIVPKANQRFTGMGQSITFINGSKVLSGWTAAGASWSTSAAYTYSGRVCSNAGGCTCLPAYPACSLEEDLYVDNVIYQRQVTLSAVTGNSWYWDKTAGRIYIGANPAGHTVEVSVVTDGFKSNADGVIIQQMTVEKFAGTAIRSRIPGLANSHNWRITNTEARFSHLAGIAVGTTMGVYNVKICDNGKLGLVGGGDGSVIQDSEICRNNFAGYQSGRGASKIDGTTNFVYRGNYVHDNLGAGLHNDSGSVGTLYESNHLVNNQNAGIEEEISHGGIIRYNLLENECMNLANSYSMNAGAPIWIAASDNVEVYGNTIKASPHGIGAYQALRNDNLGTHYIKNLNVHDNTVDASVVAAGIASVGDPLVYPQVYDSWNNKFSNNTYTVPTATGKYWEWKRVLVTLVGWKAAGQN